MDPTNPANPSRPAQPPPENHPLWWLSNGKHSTYCRSLRCCRFFLNTFLTRSRRKAARSTESVVPLFFAGPAALSSIVLLLLLLLVLVKMLLLLLLRMLRCCRCCLVPTPTAVGRLFCGSTAYDNLRHRAGTWYAPGVVLAHFWLRVRVTLTPSLSPSWLGTVDGTWLWL